jgi:hypothetical protein
VKTNLRDLLKILFLLLIYPQIGISQSKSSIGFELGIAISQFKTENVVYESGETRTTKIRPIISPLIGISKDWPLKKHFQITTGLQYQIAGYKSYCYTDYTATEYYSEEWETFKMHKLCFPLTLGYIFKIGKISPSFYLGVRPNIILSGNIWSKYHSIIIYQDRTDNMDVENELNLFDRNEYFIPPKRISNQFCFGLSTSIGQHIKFNINYTIGYNYYKNIYVSRGNYSTYTWSEKTSIPSCDYIISLKYILNIKKKAQNTDDKE